MTAENGLVWYNFYKEINDNLEINSADEEVTKRYKGQWRSDDNTIWEGFGTIRFSDGSIYQG